MLGVGEGAQNEATKRCARRVQYGRHTSWTFLGVESLRNTLEKGHGTLQVARRTHGGGGVSLRGLPGARGVFELVTLYSQRAQRASLISFSFTIRGPSGVDLFNLISKKKKKKVPPLFQSRGSGPGLS